MPGVPWIAGRRIQGGDGMPSGRRVLAVGCCFAWAAASGLTAAQDPPGTGTLIEQRLAACRSAPTPASAARPRTTSRRYRTASSPWSPGTSRSEGPPRPAPPGRPRSRWRWARCTAGPTSSSPPRRSRAPTTRPSSASSYRGQPRTGRPPSRTPRPRWTTATGSGTALRSPPTTSSGKRA